MQKSHVFLTTQEAIEAIIIDFRQYDPQIMLFCSIISLLSRDKIHFKREPGKEGVWVNQHGRSDMCWLEGDRLISFMCALVRQHRWNRELLATICSRVFQGRTQPAVDDSGREGVRIETHMGSFSCRQCGRCCRSLNYHNEVTDEDVAHWRTMDRGDILRWVDPKKSHNETAGYRIWVVPGTHELARTCPFLKKAPDANRWYCAIHAVKPQICRNYPVNRKHAVMTGCRGFEKP